MKQQERTGGWRLNLALTAGIMATVLIALVMAQLDALQRTQPQYSRLVIANVQATAVSNGSIISLPYRVIDDGFPVILDLNATVSPDSNPRVTGADAGSAAEFPVCGAVPTGWILYTVGAGETASLLAAATQSDANAILAANCLTGDSLTAGMQILLPSEPVEVLQCGPPQWWGRYQVQAGDSIAALAASRGTTVSEVLRANCRDSEDLTAGQMIFLPPIGPVAPPVVQPPAPPIPAATATVPVVPTAVPTIEPVPPTAVPPTAVPPTAIVPTVPPVPTRVVPTATPPFQVTATPPIAPTTPPTAVPPTAVPPTATSPAPTSVPTSVPTRVPPTATVPPPPTVAPSATPEPQPTNTPAPPPTAAPTATPEPVATTTPEPEPTEAWPGRYLWWWHHISLGDIGDRPPCCYNPRSAIDGQTA